MMIQGQVVEIRRGEAFYDPIIASVTIDGKKFQNISDAEFVTEEEAVRRLASWVERCQKQGASA